MNQRTQLGVDKALQDSSESEEVDEVLERSDPDQFDKLLRGAVAHLLRQ